MGFRKFLTRQSAEPEAEDLLERLAELGREPPTGLIAPLTTEDEAPAASTSAAGYSR